MPRRRLLRLATLRVRRATPAAPSGCPGSLPRGWRPVFCAGGCPLAPRASAIASACTAPRRPRASIPAAVCSAQPLSRALSRFSFRIRGVVCATMSTSAFIGSGNSRTASAGMSVIPFSGSALTAADSASVRRRSTSASLLAARSAWCCSCVPIPVDVVRPVPIEQPRPDAAREPRV